MDRIVVRSTQPPVGALCAPEADMPFTLDLAPESISQTPRLQIHRFVSQAEFGFEVIWIENYDF